jgi:hypothetical protein
MFSRYEAAPSEEKPEGNSKGSFRESVKVMRSMLPYLWPKESPWLRVRVGRQIQDFTTSNSPDEATVLSLICLVLSKAFTVLVPFVYGYVVDALSPSDDSQKTWFHWQVFVQSESVQYRRWSVSSSHFFFFLSG